MKDRGAVRQVRGHRTMDRQEETPRQQRGTKQSRRYCAICGRMGHAAFECNDTMTDEEDNQCWNCGKEGHGQWECPEPRKGKAMGSRRRWSGKGESHSLKPPPPTWFSEPIAPAPNWMVSSSSQVQWLVDTGCTGHHISPQRTLFRNYRQVMHNPIGTAGKEELHAQGQGDIDGLIWTATGLLRMTFCDVLYVPEATESILSVERMEEQGVETYMGLGRRRLHYEGITIPVERTLGREYKIRMIVGKEAQDKKSNSRSQIRARRFVWLGEIGRVQHRERNMQGTRKPRQSSTFGENVGR